MTTEIFADHNLKKRMPQMDMQSPDAEADSQSIDAVAASRRVI